MLRPRKRALLLRKLTLKELFEKMLREIYTEPELAKATFMKYYYEHTGEKPDLEASKKLVKDVLEPWARADGQKIVDFSNLENDEINQMAFIIRMIQEKENEAIELSWDQDRFVNRALIKSGWGLTEQNRLRWTNWYDETPGQESFQLQKMKQDIENERKRKKLIIEGGETILGQILQKKDKET